MRVRTVEGRPLDADVAIEKNGASVSVTFESRGPERNTEYIPTFNLVLRRLASLNAVLLDGAVVSSASEVLSPEDRALKIAGRSYPVALAEVDDVDELGNALRSSAAMVGRAANARPRGGNPTKRVKLVFQVDDLATFSEENVVSVLIGGREASDSEQIEQIVRPHKRRVSDGQGFGLTSPQRRAVEQRAMELARAHYEQRWPCVEDVSMGECFDLRCRNADQELHVEVKGTTGMGKSILLTRNEVGHATALFPRMALFLVKGVTLVEQTPGTWVARDGLTRVIEPWDLSSCQIEMIAAQCMLPPE
jgi:hypothetical protein